jgi:hypothetical protein
MDRLPEWGHQQIRNLAGMWVWVPPLIARECSGYTDLTARLRRNRLSLTAQVSQVA